jgi:F-type H+-transporting ATPase subunit delta
MAHDPTARHARTAARLDADVTRERIAAVYAEALLGVGQGAGRVEELLGELEAMVDEVLQAFPNFDAVLGSALVSHEEKLGLIDRVFSGKLSTEMLNFLKVLSRHGRLDLLRPILREARRQYQRLQGRYPVEVLTAVPLDPALADQLLAALRAKLPGQPVLEVRVDPSIIGGLVVRTGDTVYDASVASQLDALRKQIVDRSAHEIQSGRDRFRYPAGS